MKVAIYARVSKADRNDSNSIPVQLADCRRWAAEEGHEIVTEYVDEGKSGWNARVRRAGYERMVADLEGGAFDAPLARDTERLFRQDRERDRWLRLHEEGKVRRLLFADEDAIDFTRARSRESFKNRAAGAVAFSERLGEKLQATSQARAEAGLYMGKQPFGYEIVPCVGGKTLRVKPNEADAIRRAAEAVLNGTTLKAIARDWTARRLAGRVWTGSRVRDVLIAPRVAGKRVHRGKVIGRAGWDPILDTRTWERLVRMLTSEERTAVYRTRGDAYVLTGLLRCSECGSRLVGRPVTWYAKRTGEQRRYRTYVCTAGGHPNVQIKAKDLETWLGDVCHLRTTVHVRVRDPREVPPELLAQRDELDERIRAWNREAARAGLPAEEIFDGRAELVGEREQIETAIAALAQVEERPEPLWKADEHGRPTPEWRAFIASRVARVTVRPAGGRGVPVADRIEIAWQPGTRDLTDEELAEL